MKKKLKKVLPHVVGTLVIVFLYHISPLGVWIRENRPSDISLVVVLLAEAVTGLVGYGMIWLIYKEAEMGVRIRKQIRAFGVQVKVVRVTDPLGFAPPSPLGCKAEGCSGFLAQLIHGAERGKIICLICKQEMGYESLAPLRSIGARFSTE